MISMCCMYIYSTSYLAVASALQLNSRQIKRQSDAKERKKQEIAAPKSVDQKRQQFF